jgi:phenylalanyl-tRNA synthetase beta chain
MFVEFENGLSPLFFIYSIFFPSPGRVNLPVKIFELSDVVLKSSSTDTGAKNCRRVGALYCGNTSGFEVIHGLVDLILHQLGAVFKADVPKGAAPALVYSIQKSEDPTFFPGRRADVLLNGSATTP